MKKLFFILIILLLLLNFFNNTWAEEWDKSVCLKKMGEHVKDPKVVCFKESWDSGALDKLIKFRFSALGSQDKLQINSGYRNDSTGAHGDGLAFDIQVPQGKQKLFYNGFVNAGFKRIGFMSNTAIHIDLRDPATPEAWYWCYSPSTHEGSRFYCQTNNGNLEIVKNYTEQDFPECGGIEEHGGEKCPLGAGGNSPLPPSPGNDPSGVSIGGKNNKSTNNQNDKKQLDEICQRVDENGKIYGVIGYNGVCENESGGKAFLALIQWIFNWVMRIAFILSVLVLFYSGFILLMANGQPAKRTQALNIFKNVLIGLFLITAAWLLVDWFFGLFGIDDAYKFTKNG